MKKYCLKHMIIFIYLQMAVLISAFAADPVTSTIKGYFYRDKQPVSIEITDGKIVKIEHLKETASDPGSPKVYVAPGLVEVQINGYMGVDFSGDSLTLDGVRKATRELWKQGITTYLPTVISEPHALLIKNFTILSQALDDPEIGVSIPGFHLEGPFISPVQGFRGAHLEKNIRKPDWNEFMEYQHAAKNGIRIITVAPEVEGAIPFIRKCVESGVVVSLGHHNGSAEIIKEAVDAGASMSTHLGNGCANMINRHNNPLWPQLAEDQLTPSIITDGYHLTSEEIQTFYKVKGPGNLILISDALDLAGLKPGIYERGGRKLLLTPHVVKFPDQDVLAGAASTLNMCLSHMLNVTQCSLEEGIQMASTNPAKKLNLKQIGDISQGKRADLILFTIENGNIVIQKTIIAGKVVYTKS